MLKYFHLINTFDFVYFNIQIRIPHYSIFLSEVLFYYQFFSHSHPCWDDLPLYYTLLKSCLEGLEYQPNLYNQQHREKIKYRTMTDTLVRRKRMPLVQHNSVSVYVRNYAKKTIVVKVPPRVRLQVIRHNIKQRMKIPEENQILFLNGHLISDETEEIEVENRYIFHLVNLKRVGTDAMSIFVKRIQKQSPIFKYTIQSDMKICDFIKQMLSANFPDSQNYFLVYTGRQMLPCNTFKIEYVEDQSEILCVHKVQDRKNQCIELRKMPSIETNPEYNMVKKSKSLQNEKKPYTLEYDKGMKIIDEELQSVEEQCKEVKEGTNKQNMISKEPLEQSKNNFSNQHQKQKQQKSDPNQEDDDYYEEIQITNKQKYSRISKNKPSRQNTNIPKKTRSTYAPQPLKDDSQEEQSKKEDLSISNLRENNNLGLTVISSRHDEEESIEPHDLQYRQMLTKDEGKDTNCILRTQSQPLEYNNKLEHRNMIDSIDIVKQTQLEQEKPEQNINKIVVVEEVQVCNAVQAPEQPPLSYDGPQYLKPKKGQQIDSSDLLKQKPDNNHLVILQNEKNVQNEDHPHSKPLIPEPQPRLVMDLGEGNSYQIKDLQPIQISSKNIRNVFNPHLTQNQQQPTNPNPSELQDSSDNDDSLNIKRDNNLCNQGKADQIQEKGETSTQKKQLKSDTDSLLLDEDEIQEHNQNVFGGRFSWNDFTDDKVLADMSARLQESKFNFNDIVPGNNLESWQKLSFSFRNNEKFEIKTGDLFMLGNPYSLGTENIRDELYAEFQQKLLQLQVQES